MKYTINKADVSFKDLNTDTVVLKISSGDYYSFSGPARDIWSCLKDPVSPAEIEAHLKKVYEHEDVQTDIAEFLNELVQEQLIVTQ